LSKDAGKFDDEKVKQFLKITGLDVKKEGELREYPKSSNYQTVLSN